MLTGKNRSTFNAFYDAVRDENHLDTKTTILIGLAAAMTSGCAP
ncbi:MAG: carboxymuconolactone decarboxylase family protein [Deltaproteobacteria bacterium]|jgi:alkylhydroperoxidase/carboxymuconolactone decarboxylase family protein YurZ|nr:carboxymuconolactone decarboxylase family protein [Deltaproteobacteria bacterium]MCW9048999.1 carboxymuconolactone decarboxylase family protein [Deltaproteobacteria bacterium]